MHWRNDAHCRFAADPSEQTTRDPLMVAYWERVLNGLVYELYFPEELHAAGLRLFDLVASTDLPSVEQTFLSASSFSNTDKNVCATFLTHLHKTLNAPSHPIRNRLLRLTADSPDLLAVIKQEGRV
jgi:hypothetical protein